MLTNDLQRGIIWLLRLLEVILMSEIGKNIRKLREKRGMSQEELALKVGYTSRTTINKIELGINDPPRSKVELIADALYTTPAVLMGWVEEEVTEKNDVLANIVLKMREDEELLAWVAKLTDLSAEKRQALTPVIDAFLAVYK